MLPEPDRIRGIHPGIVLERELRARKLKKGRFALDIGEYPQVLTAITKQRRGINPALSLKLAGALGCEDSYFQVLQAHYDVGSERSRKTSGLSPAPDLQRIRRILFWDTDFESIDWEKNRKAVLERVARYGNEAEKAEICNFYGIKPGSVADDGNGVTL